MWRVERITLRVEETLGIKPRAKYFSQPGGAGSQRLDVGKMRAGRRRYDEEICES